jgi:predicted phage tail protein
MTTLRSRAYGRILDLVSEGEIEGLVDGAKSIYLDDTPLQNPNGSYNFQNVTYETRSGSNDQSHIAGFPSVEAESVVGLEVKKSASVTRTISNPDVDAVRVTVSLPALYRQQDDGDLKGTSVSIAIDVQSNGGGFVPQIISRQYLTETTTISAGTFRSVSSNVYGMALTVQWGNVAIDEITNAPGFDESIHVVQYKASSASTWITTDIRRVIGENNTEATFYTPTLPAGQYDIRVIATVGTNLPPIISASAATGSPYDVISGKAQSKYQRSYRVQLSGSGPWDIRVRRLTDDTTSPKIQNKTYWDGYTEIIDAKLRYPNSALVALKFDASSFSGIPRRAYDLKLRRVQVPINYNPVTRAYTGTWNGTFKTAWTDNPAWCFYDLVTNPRYGLGGFVDPAQVDKWALYSIGQYCDELVDDGFGGTEPRFTCNIYMQSRAEAYKVVQDMASCFRSMVYWASGSLTLSQDAPSDPVALFTQSNVVDGLFTYSGSSAKARHTVALVSWNDPADLYKQKVEYVEDQDAIARFGVVQTEIVATGCTSRGQAARVGRWLLYSERYESETVTFRTGIEGAVAKPGQIVKVADASRAGVRLGGRVRSATTSAITLDAPVTLGTASWTIYAMLPDGTVAQGQVASASGNTVNLAAPISAAPQPGAQWIMSASSVEAQTFRVLSAVEQDQGIVEITALRHDPDKYDAVENGLVLQPRDITELTPVPAAPTDLVAAENLYTYQAEVRAMVNIGWSNVHGASTYRVQWSKDDGNFAEAITSTSDYDILDITPGTFVVRVYSIGPTGKQSATYAEATITALGKTAPPANVVNLASSIDKDIGVTLTWDKVADLDLDVYEIRQGTNWDTATVIGQVKATVYTLGYIPTGGQTYLVKALDTTGNYSTTAAAITVSLSAPTAVSLTQEVIDNNVLLRWTASSASLTIRHYLVRRGSTWAGATEIGTVAGLFSAIFETVAGTFTYWVAAVDLAGNVGTPTPVSALVSQPPDYQLKLNQNSTFSGTKSNMAAMDGAYLAPADTSETWQSHFTSRGWTTPQDQINAGFPVYAMPAPTSGYYEEIIDYGSVLASTKIGVTLSYVTSAGTVTVTPTISVRKLTTDPWTNYAGLSSVFATDFRYVKVRFDFAGSGNDDFITITGMNVRMDVKLKNDAGTGTAVSTDSGGTPVNFNVSFIDIESITVTPSGTAARIAVYDFVDVPNPTSFKVLLFDTAGNRVSGGFSWSAKGV